MVAVDRPAERLFRERLRLAPLDGHLAQEIPAEPHELGRRERRRAGHLGDQADRRDRGLAEALDLQRGFVLADVGLQRAAELRSRLGQLHRALARGALEKELAHQVGETRLVSCLVRVPQLHDERNVGLGNRPVGNERDPEPILQGDDGGRRKLERRGGAGRGWSLWSGERETGGEQRESEHGAGHHLPPVGCRATTVRLVGRSHSCAVRWMSSGVTASMLGSIRFTAAGSLSKRA